MKEQIETAVRSLEELLWGQKELTDQLLACEEKTEAALIGNDLDGLREVVECEEELSLQFAERERIRIQKVQMLAALLEISEPDVSLKKIGKCLPNREAAARLEQVGGALVRSIARAQKKSHTVKELLLLKNDYTDTMLRLLTGSGASRSQSYGGHGERAKTYDENGGMYEVLI